MTGYVRPQKAEQSFESKAHPVCEPLTAPQPYQPDAVVRVPMSTSAINREQEAKDGRIPV